MAAYAVGESLLGEPTLFAQSHQTFMEIARWFGAGHKCRIKRRLDEIDRHGLHMVLERYHIWNLTGFCKNPLPEQSRHGAHS